MKKVTKNLAALVLTLAMVLSLFAFSLPAHAADSLPDNAKILSIGNAASRDCVYLLGNYAARFGKSLTVASLEGSMDTGIREHAHNALMNEAVYSYSTFTYTAGSNNIADCLKSQNSVKTIAAALSAQSWDVIILQQDIWHGGFPFAFQNGDMEYLIDYIRAALPNVKIYWNMTWAYQRSLANQSTSTNEQAHHFKEYYDNDQIAMYRAICEATNTFEERYCSADSGKYRVDGIIYTGAAIQYARNMRFVYNSNYYITTRDQADVFCRDGALLSSVGGRLLAAMTCFRTLFPNYKNIGSSYFLINGSSYPNLPLDGLGNDTNYKKNSGYYDWWLTRSSALAINYGTDYETALLNPPTVPDPNTTDGVRSYGTEADFETAPLHSYSDMVQQAVAPLKLHFPDVAVTADGSVFSCSYESTAHSPSYQWKTLAPKNTMANGVGQIRVYKSTDDGQNFTVLPLLIDQDYLEETGIASGNKQVSNRYERMKNATAGQKQALVTMCDPRDPNLTAGMCDVNGDGVKEDALFLTFWARIYYEDSTYEGGGGGIGTYLLYSTDQGKTWSKPYLVNNQNKRGDIAIFNDSHLLIPTYITKPAVSECYFDPSGALKTVPGSFVTIPETRDESYLVENEFSVVTPDGSDTVYGFVRSSGGVYRSTDRGRTWDEIDNEYGSLDQPGFCILNDHTVFATWARPNLPRFIYGKVFRTDASWNDTEANLIYDCEDTTNHDTGDPSCAVLDDGRVITVAYDTYYRAIVKAFSDPTDDSFALIDEMQSNKDRYEGSFTEDFESVGLGHYARAGVSVSKDLSVVKNGGTQALSLAGGTNAFAFNREMQGTYTVEADFVLPKAASVFFLETTLGTVSISAKSMAAGSASCSHSLPTNTTLHVKVRALGNQTSIGHGTLLGTVQAKVWQGSTEPDDWQLSAPCSQLVRGQTKCYGTVGVLLESIALSQKVKIASDIKGLVSGDSLKPSYSGYVHTQIAVTPNIQPVQPLIWSSDNPHIASVDANGVITLLHKGSTTIRCRTLLGASKSTTVTVKDSPAEIRENGGKTMIADLTNGGGFNSDSEMDTYFSLRNSYGAVGSPSSAGLTTTGGYLTIPAGDSGEMYYKTAVSGEGTMQFDFWRKGKRGTFYVYLFFQEHVIQFTDQGVRINPYGQVLSEDFLVEESLSNDNNWMTVKIARTTKCICFKMWPQGTPEPLCWQYCYEPADSTAKNSLSWTGTYARQFAIRNVAPNNDLCIDNLKISQYASDASALPGATLAHLYDDRYQVSVENAPNAAHTFVSFTDRSGKAVYTVPFELHNGRQTHILPDDILYDPNYNVTLFFFDSDWKTAYDPIVLQ